MRLLVDMGNSRVKWRGEGVSGDAPMSQLEGVIEKWRILNVDNILVSCVSSSPVKRKLVSLCADNLSVEPQFVVVAQGFMSLKLAYERVENLGVDRWLAMLWGLSSASGKDFVVVDAGTAITVDFVRGSEHLGGWILPGFGYQCGFYESLFEQTAISGVEFSEVNPGRSTIECVRSGLGVVAHGMSQNIQGSAHSVLDQPTIFMTGGDARLMSGLIANCAVWENMVLDGLSLLPLN